MIDRRNDINAETGYFEMIYKQVIPKTPAYMGLNLSLRGQKITPKYQPKRDIKSPSVQSIYALARLASASNKPPRKPSTGGPTILDFMQCLNFKTKLDREKDLIRKKIRTSSLYRKPSFTYNIYNPLSSPSSNKISKNIKNDFKEEFLKKSVKIVGDESENDGNTDDKTSSAVNIQCIGNKYVDLSTTFLSTSPKYLESSLMPNDLKSNSVDWEKASTSILNLSPSSSTSSYHLLLKKQLTQENLKKPKTAKTDKFLESSLNDCDSLCSDKVPNNTESSNHIENVESNFSNQQLVENPPQAESEKRKKSSKLFKKYSNSHIFAVGLKLRSKYNDANISQIETENILPNQKPHNAAMASSKSSKKSSPRKSSKKLSSHKSKDNSHTTKGSTKSANSNNKKLDL